MPALTPVERTRWRMRSLGLTGPARGTPVQVASHLLAVQSQDHGPSCWALGQRTRRPSATAVDDAFDRGDLLRLHVLRPTWHTVARADAPWLVALTAPGVERTNTGPYREEGLTPEVLSRSRNVVGQALDGSPRTRAELGALLAMTGRRLGYVMHHLELAGVVCSGPRRGKHHTYALVCQRVPAPHTPDDPLGELARRYATSHGPVTPHDLATWSSIPPVDARAGLERAGLAQVDVDGTAHWHAPEQSLPRRAAPRWRLLQLYDELVVGYRHSGHVLGSEARTLAQKRAEPQALVLRDEQVVGRWRRAGKRVELLLHEGTRTDVQPAVDELGAFLGEELT